VVAPSQNGFQLTQWLKELKRFAKPETFVLFCLGFSAGLPYLLIFSTLSAWLAEAGIEYATIGFFAWIGLTFSLKFLWAPVVDQLRLPLLYSWLGQRRSWLLLAQLGIIGGLVAMSLLDPTRQLVLLAQVAILVAICSATQDVCVDAYRVQAIDKAMQGVVTSAYIAGYRIALLVAGAGALLIAEWTNWSISYQWMAAIMGLGVLTTLCMREPATVDQQAQSEQARKAAEYGLSRWGATTNGAVRAALVWLWVHVVDPFAELARRFGPMLVLLLTLVLIYRASDIAMGNMANPFYLALGYSKEQIAWVTKVFGLVLVLIGSGVGGICVARYGLFKSMLGCLVAVVATNALFAVLARLGACQLTQAAQTFDSCEVPAIGWLAMVICADNLAAGASNVAFIAFLSHQVNVAYSASQYALLSSLMTLLGKFVSGFSGLFVAQFGFNWFFIYTASLGVPALLMLIWLARVIPKCFIIESSQEQRGID